MFFNIASQLKTNFGYLKNTDADCGEGFVRVDDVCLNISSLTTTKENIPTLCASIGAIPMITQSASMAFQIQVSKQHEVHMHLHFRSFLFHLGIFTGI